MQDRIIMESHKLLFIGVLLLYFFCNPLQAQIFKGEVFAGGSMSQVDGDECYGYERINAQAGVGVLWSVLEADWLDVGLEVLYNPKGALRADTLKYNSGSFYGLYNLKLNYVEVPLMFYFTDKHRYSVGLGFSYGRLVSVNERINNVETNTRIGDGKLRWIDGFDGVDGFDVTKIRITDDLDAPELYDNTQNPPTLLVQNSDTYSRNDYSICADFRIRIWKGLHAQLRYQYSLAPIRIRLYEEYKPYLEYKVRQQYNNQITLRLTYIIGEDLTKLNRAIQKEEKKNRY